MSEVYDLVVIGAGSGGVRCARVSASFGAKVAIVEASRLGGTCVNLGCVPKKLLAYASHFHQDFKDAKGFGWSSSPQFDWANLVGNKNREITRLNDVYKGLLEDSGVNLIRGWGAYTGAHQGVHQVTVATDGEDVLLRARRVLLATGSHPRRPSGPGADHIKVSDDVFELPALPERLALIGGGYIAVEFASIFAGLGVEVHLMVRGQEVLKGFDQHLITWVSQAFEQRGIQMHFNSRVVDVVQDSGHYRLDYEHNGMVRPLQVDLVVAAIGRDPQVPEGVAASLPRGLDPLGFVPVNQEFETELPGLYALGDLIHGPALTPVAIKQGQWLANQWFGQVRKSFVIPSIPTAVFTHPALATVGATEAALVQQGIAYRTYLAEFRPMKHTLAENPLKVGIKLLVSEGDERVLGLHMCGDDAPEIVQCLAVAFDKGMTKTDLDQTLGIHPTVAEEWVTLK